MYTNCHSFYSLRYGTFSEIDLLKQAKHNDIVCVALTDINSTSAALSFLQEAAYYNVWPVVGVDFRNGVQQQYVMLAKTNVGYQNICTHLSSYLHQEKEFEAIAPQLEDTYVIYPFEQVCEQEKTDFEDNEYIGISVRNLNRLPFSPYKKYTHKLIVQQTVTFRGKEDYNAHRLLRCIDLNILGTRLSTDQQGDLGDQMLSKEKLLEQYADYPFMLETTKRIMQSCKVDFFFGDHRTNQNQDVFLGSKEEDFEYLKKLTYQRLPNRFKEITPDITERIEKELDAIEKMDFVTYFLINDSILEYARSRNFSYIGRGSGANSLIAYILGITNVDPIQYNLYFERFINVYRSSPPDFDIDFSWKDRDEIIQYIFDTFDNVALMGTYVTFQYRSVVRELAKVFGIPKMEVDSYLDGRSTEESNDVHFRQIERYGALIHGMPSQTSVHASGILILKRPVYYYSATTIFNKNFETAQFDMNIAEEVGIFKFDILSQRGLSKINDAVAIITYNQPEADLPDIEDTRNIQSFMNDPSINALLKVGDCMGVFYIESPLMRGLMTQLRTDNYLNLVAASSIIRPGVSNSGMKHEFVLRHRYPEKRKEAHPVMMELLPETYGVMVYQEDVLKVAHAFAGLSMSEADILRRGMRKKLRSRREFEKIEAKFKSNCLKRGHSQKDTEDIWSQILSFGGYAFAKGHSASYAVESYQSLYLKRYFPLEFMTAVLNNGGGFYKPETYLQEVRAQGGIVEPPCINHSDHPYVIYGKTVYMGLGTIKSLELPAIERILTERQLHGTFQDFDDFFERVPIGKEQLLLLVKSNCFRFTGEDKHKLMWEVHFKIHSCKERNTLPKLFTEKPIHYTIPDIRTTFLIEAFDQLALFEFPLCSRFELLCDTPTSSLKAADLPKHLHQIITIYGQLIVAKPTPDKKGNIMMFSTFYDLDSKAFDTVHSPEVTERFPMKAKGIYKVIGKVTEKMGYYALDVREVIYQAVRPDPRYRSSWDSGKKAILE